MYAIRSYYARQRLSELSVATLETIGQDLAAALGQTIVEREELKHRVTPAFSNGATWADIGKKVRALAA